MYISVQYLYYRSIGTLRDIHTLISIGESELVSWRGAANMVQKSLILPQSEKGLEITPGIAIKNNHKGYISSFTNTVSYSV
jgi:hypothetical protein